MTRLPIGKNVLELHGPYVTTILPDGTQTTAAPNMRPVDFARAEALGYGADIVRMTRDHEILHTLVPVWLGQAESPVMRGVVNAPNWWPHWRQEEAVLLALQRYCNTLGVDVLELAERMRWEQA